MKITVKEKENSQISFHLPVCFLRSKFFCKLICSKCEDKELATLINLLAKHIKKHVKENGHFVLVEIETKESEKVIIKV